MNTFINYLIEANLGLVFFMLIYWIGLRKETQFSFQRIYLVSTLMFSLLFPLFHFNVNNSQVIPSISHALPSSWLPEMVVYANNAPVIQPSNSPAWPWMEWAYMVISSVLAVIFISQLMGILRLYLKSKKYHWNNFLVSETNENKPTFSFFRFIFIGQADMLTSDEKEEILFHESIHATKAHSFDILLVNVVGILFWFNPIVRVYKSLLFQLHEFEADAQSVQNKDVETYCGLLAKVALQSAGFPLVNHFNQSLTIERINMMKTIKQKIQRWKLAALVIAIPLFFIGVACQDQIANDLSKSTLTQMSDYPPEVKTAIAQLKLKEPNAVFTYVQGSEEDIEKMAKRSEQYKFVRKTFTWDQTTGAILSDVAFAGDIKTSDGVYLVVEEPASPVGGMAALHKFISMNITYPREAREKLIEGTVYIEFIVNESGKLSDFNVVKSVTPLLDNEAIRVIQNGPDWTPGKQRGVAVKMRYTVPISYKLGIDPNAAAENKNNHLGIIIQGEVEQAALKMTIDYQISVVAGKTIVTGVVTAADGGPLPGTNIIRKGTSHGTVANSNGGFKLETEAGESLVFSFVGFETKEIQIH